jgi:hypothetical protein
MYRYIKKRGERERESERESTHRLSSPPPGVLSVARRVGVVPVALWRSCRSRLGGRVRRAILLCNMGPPHYDLDFPQIGFVFLFAPKGPIIADLGPSALLQSHGAVLGSCPSRVADASHSRAGRGFTNHWVNHANNYACHMPCSKPAFGRFA